MENRPLSDEPQRFRILIVDDEPMLRSVIQDFLSMLGFEDHIVAGDGLDALETIRANEIDCVLSDIRMPKMELEELLGILTVEYPELVVIATSGYSDFQSAYNIFIKGAHDFLGKPLNLDALEIALNWVRERQLVLIEAKRLFGSQALPVMPEDHQKRIDTLSLVMREQVHHFHPLIETSIRLSGLARRLRIDLDPQCHCDLVTAAMLHELGASYQMRTLCELPRRLEEDELRLVQAHEMITARIIANTLDRPEFSTVIGRHLEWMKTTPEDYAPSRPEEKLSVWLGLINYIDGWLQDRPDRPAVSTDQLFDIVKDLHKQNSLAPLKSIMQQWPVVEAYYA